MTIDLTDWSSISRFPYKDRLAMTRRGHRISRQNNYESFIEYLNFLSSLQMYISEWKTLFWFCSYREFTFRLFAKKKLTRFQIPHRQDKRWRKKQTQNDFKNTIIRLSHFSLVRGIYLSKLICKLMLLGKIEVSEREIKKYQSLYWTGFHLSHLQPKS